MNEQELCKKRLIDLSKQANRKGIVLFSDFLNLNELNIYHQCMKSFETKTESFGGIPCAERQIIAFIPDALYYEWEYPIAVLKATPAYPKFAEKLGHRDVLGAIMKLGVDRGKLGDIILEEQAYYILCEDSMASCFTANLTQIRHTIVKVEVTNADSLSIRQHFTEKEGVITSNRLDALLACVHKLSRSQAQELLRSEKVFVNGKSILNPAHTCKKDDIISVRGYGRFVYDSEYGETNKGRIKIKYKLYNS